LNADISNQNVLINNFTGLPATIFKQYISLFTAGFYANSSGPYVQQPSLVGTAFEFDQVELVADTAAGGINWNGTSTGVFGTGSIPSNQFYCQWDNDSVAPAFDGGGNYNNATFEYTIPVTGYYAFYSIFDCIIDRTGMSLADTTVLKMRLWRSDSSYTTVNLLNIYDAALQGDLLAPLVKNFQMQVFSGTAVLMNATDKIFVTLEFSENSPFNSARLFIKQISHFTLTFTNVDGGDAVQVQDGNNYLLKNEWSGNLPLPTWQQILASPFSRLAYQVNDAGEGRNMWILDMTRNLLSGQTEAQLTGRLVDQVPPDFENLNGEVGVGEPE